LCFHNLSRLFKFEFSSYKQRYNNTFLLEIRLMAFNKKSLYLINNNIIDLRINKWLLMFICWI